MISAYKKIKIEKGVLLFCGLLIILMLSCLGYSQALAAADERTAALIEGAKKEGKLVIY